MGDRVRTKDIPETNVFNKFLADSVRASGFAEDKNEDILSFNEDQQRGFWEVASEHESRCSAGWGYSTESKSDSPNPFPDRGTVILDREACISMPVWEDGEIQGNSHANETASELVDESQLLYGSESSPVSTTKNHLQEGENSSAVDSDRKVRLWEWATIGAEGLPPPISMDSDSCVSPSRSGTMSLSVEDEEGPEWDNGSVAENELAEAGIDPSMGTNVTNVALRNQGRTDSGEGKGKSGGFGSPLSMAQSSNCNSSAPSGRASPDNRPQTSSPALTDGCTQIRRILNEEIFIEPGNTDEDGSGDQIHNPQLEDGGGSSKAVARKAWHDGSLRSGDVSEMIGGYKMSTSSKSIAPPIKSVPEEEEDEETDDSQVYCRQTHPQQPISATTQSPMLAAHAQKPARENSEESSVLMSGTEKRFRFNNASDLAKALRDAVMVLSKTEPIERRIQETEVKREAAVEFISPASFSSSAPSSPPRKEPLSIERNASVPSSPSRAIFRKPAAPDQGAATGLNSRESYKFSPRVQSQKVVDPTVSSSHGPVTNPVQHYLSASGHRQSAEHESRVDSIAMNQSDGRQQASSSSRTQSHMEAMPASNHTDGIPIDAADMLDRLTKSPYSPLALHSEQHSMSALNSGSRSRGAEQADRAQRTSSAPSSAARSSSRKIAASAPEQGNGLQSPSVLEPWLAAELRNVVEKKEDQPQIFSAPGSPLRSQSKTSVSPLGLDGGFSHGSKEPPKTSSAPSSPSRMRLRKKNGPAVNSWASAEPQITAEIGREANGDVSILSTHGRSSSLGAVDTFLFQAMAETHGSEKSLAEKASTESVKNDPQSLNPDLLSLKFQMDRLQSSTGNGKERKKRVTRSRQLGAGSASSVSKNALGRLLPVPDSSMHRSLSVGLVPPPAMDVEGLPDSGNSAPGPHKVLSESAGMQSGQAMASTPSSNPMGSGTGGISSSVSSRHLTGSLPSSSHGKDEIYLHERGQESSGIITEAVEEERPPLHLPIWPEMDSAASSGHKPFRSQSVDLFSVPSSVDATPGVQPPPQLQPRSRALEAQGRDHSVLKTPHLHRQSSDVKPKLKLPALWLASDTEDDFTSSKAATAPPPVRNPEAKARLFAEPTKADDAAQYRVVVSAPESTAAKSQEKEGVALSMKPTAKTAGKGTVGTKKAPNVESKGPINPNVSVQNGKRQDPLNKMKSPMKMFWRSSK